MVKQTQTIRQQQLTYCLNVFDHFVGLALKGLINNCREKSVLCVFSSSIFIFSEAINLHFVVVVAVGLNNLKI